MFLSVIIPIYNAEAYLRRCIDSVIIQNMGDEIELLLINDGSKDSSGKICDEYSERYHWIKTFHIPNGGVGNARNYGLNHIHGDYFTFIDSDDFLEPDIYAYIHQLHAKYKADIYVFGYKDYPTSDTSQKHQLNQKLNADNESLSAIYLEMKKNYLMFPIYNKIFSSKKCKNIRFLTNIHFFEDYLFSLSCFNQVQTVYSLNQIAYNYVHHPGEHLGGKYTAPNIIIKVAKEIRDLSLTLPQNKHLTEYTLLEYYNNLTYAIDSSKRINGRIKYIKILLSEIQKYGLLNEFKQYLGRRKFLLTFPFTYSVLIMFYLRKLILKLR